MEKIYELHNDYFTDKHFIWQVKHYYNKNCNIAKKLATVVWTSELTADKAMEKIESAANFCSKNDGTFLAVEDLHFLTKPLMYKLINLQPIYCGLTWNGENNLAGGANSRATLSNFGKMVVQSLEAADIIVDTAHLNEVSFMAVANNTTKPLFCSHTACAAINPHQRNLKDYQIKMIAGSGGLVGLCLVSNFLTGYNRSTISDYVRHLDYAVCKFGIDHFAIGSDFCGTKHLPIGIVDYKSLSSGLAKQLLGLGYKQADIDKLFWGNAERFFKQHSNLAL